MGCEIIRFTASREEIAALVRRADQDAAMVRWELFVRRGPAEHTVIRDGIAVRIVVQPTAPRAPYGGYLIVYWDAGVSPTAAQLRAEVETAGAYNLISSVARARPTEEVIAPAFWN